MKQNADADPVAGSDGTQFFPQIAISIDKLDFGGIFNFFPDSDSGHSTST